MAATLPSMRPDGLGALADSLRASPSELVGLVVLLAGALAAGLALWAAPASDAPDPGDAAPTAALPVGQVTVHVSGAVAAPGVLTLPDDARVADAVAAAGGATADADLDALNLARPLQDGERIAVPRVGEQATVDDPGGVAADGRVDLNAAGTAELETLPGVGPVLAGRIVAYREEHGPFTDVGQLRDVSGIGERSFQALVDLVVVR